MKTYLESLTDKQLARLYDRCWARMTRYDGYQPFGYDAPTLWATRPEWCVILQAIFTVQKERRDRNGCWPRNRVR